MTPRVEATPQALEWIATLVAKHGPLMFYQHHGCCQGAPAPVCLVDGEYKLGVTDFLLGEIGGCPFYMSGQQFEQWRGIQAIIDVTPGQASGFSIEGPEGVCFYTRLRNFTAVEIEQLNTAGEPPFALSENGLRNVFVA